MSDLFNHLPQYQCTKIVRAIKIEQVIVHAHPAPDYDAAKFEASAEFGGAHLFIDGFAPIPVNAEWFRKHQPKPGGYFVVYEDGYTSWSPAEAFESGYTKI